MTKKEISEYLLELSSLQEITSKPNVTEVDIFSKIGELDKRYSTFNHYIENIDGLICNIGNDLKSIALLNYAVKRIKEKSENNNLNKYTFDIGNCIHCIAILECKYPPTLDELLSTKKFNEARNNFINVKYDEYNHFERAMTNSANILEKYGRNYEAILLYDKVLKKDPCFGMALGNKAFAIDYYIRLAPQQSYSLMREEVRLFELALNDTRLEQIGGEYAKNAFTKRKNEILEFLILNNQWDIKTENKKPINNKYEEFVIQNNLYLNYDFGYYYDKYSLQDTLFPNFSENIHDEKSKHTSIMSKYTYFGFQVFNQIMESYSSCRYTFFKTLNSSFKRYDKNIGFIYTFDYTIHGTKYGIYKDVFCSLYNCLDKIGHLVFYYFIKEKDKIPKKIYFETLQLEIVKQSILDNKSYQLLALRNLSLDFEDGYRYNHLRKLRNHITHSFLNINEGIGYSDEFAEYEITEEILIQNIYEIFSIVKSALLYYTIAVRFAKTDDINFPMYATMQKDIFY